MPISPLLRTGPPGRWTLITTPELEELASWGVVAGGAEWFARDFNAPLLSELSAELAWRLDVGDAPRGYSGS